MPPVRKSFANDALFPFELVFQDTKSPQRELPDHLHDWFEIVYVYGGRGTFFIDRNLYEMGRGDLFILPGNTIHRAFPDPDDPVTSTAVFFAPSLAQQDPLGDSYSGLRTFEDSRMRKQYKIQPAGVAGQRIEEILEIMHAELQSKKPGYRHAVRLMLQQLLLDLSRFSAPAETPGGADETRIGPPWIRQALRDIDQHSESAPGLSELAARASVSSAHFSRTFKQLTGMNVTDYVNAKRIARAKELLLEAGESVERAAERCGFESLPHFHRTFKKLTGLTPGQYKRRSP